MIFNNPSQSRESYLIVEWDKHSLSFSVFHEATNRVLATKVLDTNIDIYQISQQDIDKFLKANDIFAFNYAKVVVLVNSLYYTLVPKEIKETEHLEQLLQLNTEIPSGIMAYKNENLKMPKYNMVFAYPKYILTTFEELYKNVAIKHINGVVLDMLSLYNKANAIFNIHLSANSLIISFWNNNALLYHNTFEITTAEDIVYYTLNLMQELNLNTERTTVYYSGAFEQNGTKVNLLSDYVKFLSPLERSNKINYNKEVEAMPEHYFVHQYSLCV